MPRGGRRTGKPGVSYTNRTDLNRAGPLPVTTVPGQPYGQAGQQQAAQQAVPMAAAPTPAAAGLPAGLPPAPAPVAPGGLGAFDRPSERPDEPVTAGLPIGPGPGPEALGNLNPTHDELRALYAAYPNEDLRELLEDIDTGV